MVLNVPFIQTHNCIKELRKIITDQQIKINELSNELVKQKSDLELFTNELRLLKGFASQCFRNNLFFNSHPAPTNSVTALDHDEIAR